MHTDGEEAVRQLRVAAEKGNRMAGAVLGLLYYEGLGVPKDSAEAVRLLKKYFPLIGRTGDKGLVAEVKEGEMSPTDVAVSNTLMAEAATTTTAAAAAPAADEGTMSFSVKPDLPAFVNPHHDDFLSVIQRCCSAFTNAFSIANR